MPLALRPARGTLIAAAFAVTLIAAPTASAGPAPGTSAGTATILPPESELAPPTNCRSRVGYPQNKVLPGYLVPDEQRGQACVPFYPVDPAPAGYRGDYRVDEFTWEKAQEALARCKADPPCDAVEQAKTYTGSQYRTTGTIDPRGRIDPLAAQVDLNRIRRPGFFAQAPYHEPIAEADARSYVFELSAPADPYDRLERGAGDTVRLRGWYLKGAGVPDEHGGRRHALAVFIGGRGDETTALRDPADPAYNRNANGDYLVATYPSPGHGTEQWGSRVWREYLHKLNQAGFDVLTYDKRGHGISGGLSADNSLQQGLDELRAVDAISSGRGLRVAGPDGRTSSGRDAVAELVGSSAAGRAMPVVLGGPSQGSWTTAIAMNANFNRWCSYDLPAAPCHRPWGNPNIKGAALLSNLWPSSFGMGSVLQSAAGAEVNHTYFPTSEALGNIGSWPAVLFSQGIWDEHGGPFQTFNAYARAGNNKEIDFVRGPHSENEHGPGNVAYLQDRVVQFSVNTVLGRRSTQPVFANLQEAIAASPQVWEVTTPGFPITTDDDGQ